MSEKDEMQVEVPLDEDIFTDADAPEAEPKAEDAPVEQEAEATVEEDAPEKAPHQVPLRELLDEREKRQNMQSQLEQMQQAWQQQQAYAMQQQQAAEQGQQMPDIFEHPEYYQEAVKNLYQMPQYVQAQVQDQVNRQLSMARHEMMGEMSFNAARSADPDSFNAAWDVLKDRVNRGDNTWRQQILTSADPGRTLIDLYKRESVGDPDDYKQRLVEELKQDPNFLQEVLSAQGGHSTPTVSLPPSLNKAGGTGASYGLNLSGQSLWDEVNK
jgi:hypothetical protein